MSLSPSAAKAASDGAAASSSTPAPLEHSTSRGRMHSTVRLNQFTLRFEDTALESAYQASIHRRKKALWLRSLIPAAGSHLLFGLGDCIEHPIANLHVTLPARVFLAVLQIAMFILVNWDLIEAHETTMLLVSICNGVPSLLIYTLQRASLHQWDALFVIFGLSFYTIPKITPLGFITSTSGSWATAFLYAILSFVVRPPMRIAESILGFLYCAPVIGIFNTIAYYSEYNSRERFVLRRRLSSESITLAVARTNTLALSRSDTHPATTTAASAIWTTLTHSNHRGPTFAVGVVLWAAFPTLGGWASLPETLKFVDEATGWAWFSHCAGVTVFLLIMTRQLQWLFVVPIVGSAILWLMAKTMPSAWIIVSAHSVGYGLLVASVVVAMGVFSWFVCAWRELVSFVTRSCFLYPQLQAGLESEYPLLVKIVSEYTAGFDPALLSSRLPAHQAVGSSNEVRAALRAAGVTAETTSHALLRSATSPRQRRPQQQQQPVVKAKLLVNSDLVRLQHSRFGSQTTITEFAHDAELELSQPEAPMQSALIRRSSSSVDDDDDTSNNKIVSVLPSFKAGKCFFCSKNDAEHFVPACGMWGKWTHWRMHQQHGGGADADTASGTTARLVKPIVSMCTSYYDIQNAKSELVVRVASLEASTTQLLEQLERVRDAERATASANVQLRAELRATNEQWVVERQRIDAHWEEKTKTLLANANRDTHAHKLELKRADAARLALQQRLEAAQQAAELAEARVAELERTLASACTTASPRTAADATVVSPSSQADEASSCSPCAAPSAATSTLVTNLQTLQSSKRLPYAQFLEIEGLRESSRKRDGSTDYSQQWRLASGTSRSRSNSSSTVTALQEP